MLCGTALCDMGQVCCYKKSPPLALCIPPQDFQQDGCEKMALPCTDPSACPAGLACCLNWSDPNNPTISCESKLTCMGTGAGMKYWACSTADDCPTYAPTCVIIAPLDATTNLSICEPLSTAAP